jgi:hypothetical protein
MFLPSSGSTRSAALARVSSKLTSRSPQRTAKARRRPLTGGGLDSPALPAHRIEALAGSLAPLGGPCARWSISSPIRSRNGCAAGYQGSREVTPRRHPAREPNCGLACGNRRRCTRNRFP